MTPKTDAIVVQYARDNDLEAAFKAAIAICAQLESARPEAAHGLDEDGLQLLRDARTALDHSYDVQSYPANGKTNQDACIREIDAYLAKQLPQGD